MIRKLGCWSLRLSIGVFIGAVVFPASLAYAADDPGELVEAYAKARNARDRAALLALIHPGTVSYLRANDPDELEKKLLRAIVNPMPEAYQFELLPIEVIGPYDAAKKQVDIQFAYARLPVTPDHYLRVTAGDFDLGELIAHEPQGWFIVWPLEWIAK